MNATTMEALDTQHLKPAALGRFLGLDVRPRSFGFVVIENAIVLDSGVRRCDLQQFDDCLGQGFNRILKTYQPSSVIMRGFTSFASNSRKQKLANAIRRKAKQHHVILVSIRDTVIKNHFRRYRATTKYQIAQSVASLLPELGWKLPRNRKPWESEHYRMSIFDAAAVVIAYLDL